MIDQLSNKYLLKKLMAYFQGLGLLIEMISQLLTKLLNKLVFTIWWWTHLPRVLCRYIWGLNNQLLTKYSLYFTHFVLNNRKVTRLGIEPRPSGKIPDALTTELSGLTRTIHYVLFMHLPLQLGILVI